MSKNSFWSIFHIIFCFEYLLFRRLCMWEDSDEFLDYRSFHVNTSEGCRWISSDATEHRPTHSRCSKIWNWIFEFLVRNQKFLKKKSMAWWTTYIERCVEFSELFCMELSSVHEGCISESVCSFIDETKVKWRNCGPFTMLNSLWQRYGLIIDVPHRLRCRRCESFVFWCDYFVQLNEQVRHVAFDHSVE